MQSLGQHGIELVRTQFVREPMQPFVSINHHKFNARNPGKILEVFGGHGVTVGGVVRSPA